MEENAAGTDPIDLNGFERLGKHQSYLYFEETCMKPIITSIRV
jgi:hypothetical protein